MIASALKNALLFLLALALAVLVWAIAQIEQNPQQNRTFFGVPVEVRNVPTGLEVSAIAQTSVSVDVEAPQNTMARLSTRSFRAWIDLNGLDAGTHDVVINVMSQERLVRIQGVTPASVPVTLERIKQKVVPVVVGILDEAPGGYSIGTAVVTPTQVVISGRQSIVDQVTEAVALVRIEGARADIQRLARPVLRDGRGGEVQGNLSITPDTVTVSIPVFQLLSYKTVALRAVITGTVAPGYRLTSIVVEPQTILLGGDPRVLESIAYIETSPVDISGARADVIKPARFTLPPGVATDRKTEVFVNVSIEPIPGQEIIRRVVQFVGLDKSLRVIAPLSPTVEIELAGPLDELTKLIPTDVTVTVNLQGAGPGLIERTPVVTGLPKSLTIVRITPEKIIILLDVQVTPTPTPTPTPIVTPTLTPARLLTPTPTSTPTATPVPRALKGNTVNNRRWI